MNDFYGVSARRYDQQHERPARIFGEEHELTVAGLTEDQEMRAEALHAAARVLAGRDAYERGDVAVRDAADATVRLAAHFEAYIRDGAINEEGTG